MVIPWFRGARDSRWAETHGPLKLGLATFGILALELALIRWSAGQVRMLAYFQNVVLIAAFLGMGLGVALGRRYPGLVHFTLPVLAPLAAILAFSEDLGIMQLAFPDPSVHLWGAEGGSVALRQILKTMGVVLGLFWMVAATFIAAGSAVGCLFSRMRTLRAYRYDLLGSLLGVVAITLATALRTGPYVWLLLGCLPFIYLSRTAMAVAGSAVVVAAGWVSVGEAWFSPYNRIDPFVTPVAGVRTLGLSANRDFHQVLHDFSPATVDRLPPARQAAYLRYRQAYHLPFILGDTKQRALVVAAGTGNDVQAALRNGFQQVYSVDIDPTIIDLGRRFHPEKPYSDPRVTAVTNDARAFFEQYEGPPFDVVCYGLLDSHSMFSAMSSLRLESFVYTREGIRSAWNLVAPDGLLTITFSVYAGDWIADRLYWTIADATGIAPLMIGPTLHHGRTYVVSRDPGSLHLDRAQAFGMPRSTSPRADVTITTDDWPFLYLKPGQFPWGYVSMLVLILGTGFLAARRAFEGRVLGRDFDLPLFFMGAGFLLLEARGVTTLSLLFGSTWVVNASVFAGILVMALAANLLVERRDPGKPVRWFVPLLLAVGLLLVVRHGALNQYGLLTRGLLGGLLIGLPVGFAGILVSMMLARARNGAAALGSNLLGALVGGCLEYASMAVGLRGVAGLALLLYLAALFAFALRERRTQAPAADRAVA